MNDKSKRMSRREFMRLAGVTAGGVALAGCVPNRPIVSQKSSAPVQLVYQDWRTEWFPGMAQRMLEEFHTRHPNIRVFFIQDPDNLETKMMTDMAAGTAPDVFSGCCNFFPAWADAGYMLDLKPYVQADLDQETIKDWSPAQYNAFFTRDRKLQYGLPKYHGGLALYYNKDMFDSAHVAYPEHGWDHDDYLEMMRKLTIRSGNRTVRWGSMFDVSWDRIQIHVNGWGGHYVSPSDSTRCVMSSHPAFGAMEWLRARMWDDHVMASFVDVQNVETREAFINQDIAMVEDGSWALRDILERAKFRIGVAPFPSGPLRQVTLATTDGFGIFAKTRHPEAAWELLKFLISKDYGRAMARDHFLQPARSSLVPEWAGFIKNAYPGPAKEIDLDAFADGHMKGYSVTAEIFPNMVGVGEAAKETWDRIYTLGKAPVSDMEQVCQEIEAIQQKRTALPLSCGCETNS